MNSKLPDTARSLQALLTSHFCGLGLCCRSFPPWRLYPWPLLPQQPLPLWPLCRCPASACVPGFSSFPLLLSLHTFTLGDLAYTNKGKSFLLLYYPGTSKDLKVECSFPQYLSYKKSNFWLLYMISDNRPGGFWPWKTHLTLGLHPQLCSSSSHVP